MEIVRNSRAAKVILPSASADEVVSVEFENPFYYSKFNFGTADPTPEDVAGGLMYVESDTGYTYKAGSDGTPERFEINKFNPEAVSMEVPYEYVTYCGKFNVKWTYRVDGVAYVESQQPDVVQPLFTPEELQEFDADFESVDVLAIRRLERIVRAIIERHTGQSFELSYGVQIARSHNGSTLVLPKRAVALDGLSGHIGGVYSTLESDGWIVRARTPFEYTTKMYSNPINSESLRPAFREGTYPLKGEWGYTSVPDQITLAAMLLAQDYGCRESAWRDKYVETIKNVDWGLSFNSQSFVGTGNVKVDQILQAYILNKMVVI